MSREIVCEETSKGHFEKAPSAYMRRKLKEEERRKKRQREETISTIVLVVFFVAVIAADLLVFNWAWSKIQ